MDLELIDTTPSSDLMWVFLDFDFVSEWLPNLTKFGVAYVEYEKDGAEIAVAFNSPKRPERHEFLLKIVELKFYDFRKLEVFLRKCCGGLEGVTFVSLAKT